MNEKQMPTGNPVPIGLGKLSKGIFFLLLPILLILGSCQGNTPKPNIVQAPVNDSLAVANDTLQSRYNAASLQMDDLKTKNQVLDSQVREKDALIAHLRSQIKKLNRKDKSLQAQISRDKEMFASLKNELEDKIKSLASQIGLLQSDKDRLAAERDEMKARYQHLNDIASVLHASNFRLVALHEKRSGKKKKTGRARKADMLRIEFDLDENRVATDGVKDLYLAITDPGGRLLQSGQGGGVMKAASGSSVNYSLLKEVPVKTDEPVKDVTVDWTQDIAFAKGTYSIAVYNGGYKIGQGNVSLN